MRSSVRRPVARASVESELSSTSTTPRADAPLVCTPERDELDEVERVARAAFATRRKLLVNCLRASDVVPPDAKLEDLLAGLGSEPRARAESLAPERFLELSGRGRASALDIYLRLSFARHVFISQRIPERRGATEAILEHAESLLLG